MRWWVWSCSARPQKGRHQKGQTPHGAGFGTPILLVIPHLAEPLAGRADATFAFGYCVTWVMVVLRP